MKPGNKKRYSISRSGGFAIIAALVTMTILVLLGLAVITLSLGTLTANREDATTNDSYYAAASGVNSAIEQLKIETSNYYGQMLQAQGSAYNSLYSNFFYNIENNAQLRFAEPSIAGISTATTFSTGNFDQAQNTGEFLVSCTSTAADGTQYEVNGKLSIKRVDVRITEQFVWISDHTAVKAGGYLDLGSRNSVSAVNGDILVGSLIFDSTHGLPYTVTGGQLIIDPSIGSTIYDKLVYATYYDPIIINPNMYITTSGTINGGLPAPPVNITTPQGVNLHFTNCTIPEGTIYIKGDVHLSNCIMKCDLYCDGNVTIDNFSSINGCIYCRGNINLTNSSLGGDIHCDGLVNFGNGNISASIYAKNGISVHNATSSGNLYSPAAITIDTTTITKGLVYTSTKLTLGSGHNFNAAFFSGGDIEFTGDADVNGTVIAKGDIYFKVDANKDLFVNYSYSEATLDMLINDPKNSFFFSTPGGSRLDQSVILSQSVTPAGRIN